MRCAKALSMALAVSLFIWSCSDSIIESSNDDSSNSAGKGFGMLSTVYDDGVNLICFRVNRNASDGSLNSSDQQWMYIFDSSGDPVAANSATVESQTLTTTVASMAGVHTLSWDGADHDWSITGNSDVPTFSIAVESPNSFRITEPDTRVDTVTKSSGFTIDYDTPGTDSVAIVLVYDEFLSYRSDSNASTSYWRWETKQANTGSYSVSSSTLTGLPSSGILNIWVIAGNIEEITVTGVETRAAAVVASIATVPFK